MLYRIQITAYPRVARPAEDDHSLEALLKYFDNMVRPKRSHFSNISGILAPEREICPDCHEAEGRLFELTHLLIFFRPTVLLHAQQSSTSSSSGQLI